MTTKEIKQYYESTKNREIRADLLFALNLIDKLKIAVDCGCGAGNDIEYLVKTGFKVYGFDIEDESILLCKQRFKNNNNVVLSKETFGSYRFPKASLVLADASLFFCTKAEFEKFWQNSYECLYPDGVFCGSFLGPEDTMAGSKYDRTAFWPNILVLGEKEVNGLFEKFRICRFTEHKLSGFTQQGIPHDWHIFSVVAKKI